MNKWSLGLLVYLGLLLAQPVYAGVWETVGSGGFATSQNRIYFDLSEDGVPYVSYDESRDWGGGCCNTKSVVSKFDNDQQRWVMVGPADFGITYQLVTPKVAPIAISMTGELIASAVSGYANSQSTVFKLNGNGWLMVGEPSVAVSPYRTLQLNNNGTPFVAYTDFSRGSKASVISYTGGKWAFVGEQGFSSGSLESYGPPTLAINKKNELYVAYVESKDWGGGCCTWKLTVSKYDAASSVWIPIGNPGISTAFPYTPSLTFDGNDSPVVAFTLQDFGVVAYQFDGINWNLLSPVGARGISYLATNKYGQIYLAAGGTSTSSNDVWSYNGTNWTSLGNL